MRLVIERGELLRALGHVASVVERRTTIPILSNVLLKASGQALELKATDLEREVIEEVRAEVAAPGAVTVPAHILHDIVRKLPDGSQVDIRPVRDITPLMGTPQPFQIISPALHHLPPLRQVLGPVVDRPDLVRLGVRQLPLDHVRRPPHLV